MAANKIMRVFMLERERFETWAHSEGFTTTSNKQGYKHLSTQQMWEAWTARCPEGWQVVPAIPSDEQVEVGCAALGDCERLGECHNDCHCSPAPRVYRAMLDASP